ncbi:MAG: MgtC/SapB family protein [Bacteroidales bacterium]|jgi:putative Mg2+ transporter-C (MgtC) family protein|nr:MgtC/SapB family protein [Bacteroidales bacterium]
MNMMWTFIIRLLLATIFGALIGLEREYHAKEAGVRTHLLVALGSCLFMILSIYGFDAFLDHDNVSFDPSRIASQVVTGIGFIGAGTIILHKQAVRGLTTAAGVWVTAAIGLACGNGMYILAGVTTVTVLSSLGLINLYLPSLSQRERQITFLAEDYNVLTDILENLRKEKIVVLNYEMRKDAEENNGKMLIVLKIRMKRYDTIESMTSILKNFEKVELVQIA